MTCIYVRVHVAVIFLRGLLIQLMTFSDMNSSSGDSLRFSPINAVMTVLENISPSNFPVFLSTRKLRCVGKSPVT